MTRRLLVITPDYPPGRGGIQVLLQRVVEGMPAFIPTVVTRGEPNAGDWDSQRAYRVVRLGHREKRVDSLGPVVGGAALGLRERPDVVLAGHLLAAPAAMALAVLRGVPYALYLYGDELPNHASLLVHAMRRAQVTIAISRHTRDMAAELGAPIDRCTLIPPGVDVPEDTARRAEPGLIVTVARLTDRYKGHDLVLEALPRVRERVPGARWVIVGDGPLRAQLEEQARAAGLLAAGAVRFVGSVDDRERDDWLRRAAVFTMPSRLPPDGLGGEGFGIAFLEAGAHGVPVVAGNVGGALDAVDDGVTGLLVDPTSASELADALVRLLEDPAFARRLGAAGRARAETHAWPRIAEQVQAVLVRAADSRPDSVRPKYLPTSDVGHPFRDAVLELVDRHGVRSVCDFGGGANPVLDREAIERLGLRYLVVDIEPDELAKTPSGYETRVVDLLSDDVDFGAERFDLVVSRFVAEHMAEPSRFHSSVRKALAPGGRAAHFFPTLPSPPFVLNRVLGGRMTRAVVNLLQPGVRSDSGMLGKFTAYYRWCEGPTRRQRRRLASAGFVVEEYVSLVGHDYYAPLPKVQAAADALSRRLVRLRHPIVTTYAYVVLRRVEPIASR